jgi:hypothetical protein
LGRLWRLTLKELREILRDRRTILTLILMPLLLYPLLSIAFQQFFLSQLNAIDQPVFNLAFRNPGEGRFLVHLLREGGLTFDEPGPDPSPAGRGAVFTGHVDLDPEEALQVGRADLVIRPLGEPRGDLDPRNDLELDLELLYRDDSAVSREAADLVTEACARRARSFSMSVCGCCRCPSVPPPSWPNAGRCRRSPPRGPASPSRRSSPSSSPS